MRQQPIRFGNGGEWLYGMTHWPAGNGPFPAVILLHGFTGTRIEAHCLFVKAARAMARSGIAALRFDFRGSGESQGRFRDMTVMSEVSDALAALAFMAGQKKADPLRLGMLGLSLGGCVAAHVAGGDPRVKSLALWSAVADTARSFSKGMDAGLVRQLQERGYVDLGGNLVGEAFYRQAANIRPLEAIRGYGGPALILHGEKDEAVPVDDAHQYYDAIVGPKHLHIIPGADHTYSSEAWENEAIGETVRWFETTLVSV